MGTHLPEIPRVAARGAARASAPGWRRWGSWGCWLIFVRAYSMGAGTYTGIEAVSNGIQIMREPKVQTARRTMTYMALSLAVTAAGILILYLLFRAAPEAGQDDERRAPGAVRRELERGRRPRSDAASSSSRWRPRPRSCSSPPRPASSTARA